MYYQKGMAGLKSVSSPLTQGNSQAGKTFPVTPGKQIHPAGADNKDRVVLPGSSDEGRVPDSEAPLLMARWIIRGFE